MARRSPVAAPRAGMAARGAHGHLAASRLDMAPIRCPTLERSPLDRVTLVDKPARPKTARNPGQPSRPDLSRASPPIPIARLRRPLFTQRKRTVRQAGDDRIDEFADTSAIPRAAPRAAATQQRTRHVCQNPVRRHDRGLPDAMARCMLERVRSQRDRQAARLYRQHQRPRRGAVLGRRPPQGDQHRRRLLRAARHARQPRLRARLRARGQAHLRVPPSFQARCPRRWSRPGKVSRSMPGSRQSTRHRPARPSRRLHTPSVTGSIALASTACSSTLAPASAQAGVIASASLWLSPSMQGTKIMPVGATRAR